MGQEHIRNINLLEDAEVGSIFEPDPEMRAGEALELSAQTGQAINMDQI